MVRASYISPIYYMSRDVHCTGIRMGGWFATPDTATNEACAPRNVANCGYTAEFCAT